MGEGSKIEWTDHTFNGWIGCTKVSPGCANCYAEAYAARYKRAVWGPGQPRSRTSVANWRLPLRWNREAEAAGKRARVFCSSLADWLDPEVPAEWLRDLLELVATTGSLDWLLLTKRPELFRERMDAVLALDRRDGTLADLWSIHGLAPSNVWLGTTVEDQQRADERVPMFAQIPARVHFLSCEPLLGPVTIDPRWMPHIDWVIAGGESGPDARPMHPEWARELRDQAQSAGAAFLFKQWGEWVPEGHEAYEHSDPFEEDERHAAVDLWPRGMTPEGRISTYTPMWRAGKHTAGRVLDGRTWDEFPEPRRG